MQFPEERKKFAAITSYGLQKPLRMVANFAQLLREHCVGRVDTVADEYISFIARGVGQMQQLVTGLSVYSRIETAEDDPRLTSSEKSLRQAVLNLREVIGGTRTVVTHTSLPDLLADERIVVQLFQNLISDAIRCCRTKAPQIHFAAAWDKEKWLFSIQYNGTRNDPPFPQEIQNVMDSEPAPGKFQVSTIGLVICKKIVENHGGSLWIDSRTEQTSTINFTWPGVNAEVDLQAGKRTLFPKEVSWTAKNLGGVPLEPEAFRSALALMRLHMASAEIEGASIEEYPGAQEQMLLPTANPMDAARDELKNVVMDVVNSLDDLRAEKPRTAPRS